MPVIQSELYKWPKNIISFCEITGIHMIRALPISQERSSFSMVLKLKGTKFCSCKRFCVNPQFLGFMGMSVATIVSTV